MTPPPAPDLPASWSDEDAEATRSRGRRVWLYLAVAVVVVLGAALIAVIVHNGSSLKPQERAWPASVGGRPDGLGNEGDTAAKVDPSAPAGVYIWNGFDGWHLWLVPGDSVDAVRGTIVSSDDISKALLSAPGQGTVSRSGKTITFSLSGDAPVTGVDFEPGFFSKKLTISLTGPDGKPLSADLVTLGTSTAVSRLPIVIDKPVVTSSDTSS